MICLTNQLTTFFQVSHCVNCGLGIYSTSAYLLITEMYEQLSLNGNTIIRSFFGIRLKYQKWTEPY